MDKYRRNDDINDDLEVYNHKDVDLPPISSRSHKNTYIQGESDTDGEFEDRLNQAQAKLSPQECVLMNLILKGLSIRKASKQMKISQPMAYKYWNRIKEKLK